MHIRWIYIQPKVKHKKIELYCDRQSRTKLLFFPWQHDCYTMQADNMDLSREESFKDATYINKIFFRKSVHAANFILNKCIGQYMQWRCVFFIRKNNNSANLYRHNYIPIHSRYWMYIKGCNVESLYTKKSPQIFWCEESSHLIWSSLKSWLQDQKWWQSGCDNECYGQLTTFSGASYLRHS